MKKKTILMLLAIAFAAVPLFSAAESAKSQTLYQKLDRSLDELNVWTDKTFKDFSTGLNEALDDLEVKLKKARGKADKDGNKALDNVERELKELGRKINEFGNEKKPDKKKAHELNAEVKKISADLDSKQ